MASSTHKVRIHAQPDAVFAAIATEKGLKSWFTANIEGSLEQGGTARFGFPHGEVFEWKTTAAAPIEKIERECVSGPGVAKGTKVIWRVEAEGQGGTVVRLDHTGWPEGHEALATCNTLWGMLLGRLREYAETAKAAPLYS